MNLNKITGRVGILYVGLIVLIVGCGKDAGKSQMMIVECIKLFDDVATEKVEGGYCISVDYGGAIDYKIGRVRNGKVDILLQGKAYGDPGWLGPNITCEFEYINNSNADMLITIYGKSGKTARIELPEGLILGLERRRIETKTRICFPLILCFVGNDVDYVASEYNKIVHSCNTNENAINIIKEESERKQVTFIYLSIEDHDRR